MIQMQRNGTGSCITIWSARHSSGYLFVKSFSAGGALCTIAGIKEQNHAAWHCVLCEDAACKCDKTELASLANE